METRANYVAIGAFVMLVFMGLLGALFWLYKSSEPGATAQVRIIFTEPVTGLSTGGSVLFNGIRIGEVTRLYFAPGGGDDVIATARISQNAPIKVDTVAKLGFQGLTGVAYISLTGGTETGQSLFDVADGEIPTMRAETSAFTNVLDSAESVLQRVNTTLNEVNTFLASNRGRLDEVVANVSEITGTLNTAAPKVSGLIDDIAAAGQAVAQAAPHITTVVERANTILDAIEPGRVATIVGNVEDFSNALPDVANDARQIVGNVNGLVTRLDDTAATLGEAVSAVRDVATGVDSEAVSAILANVRTATEVLAGRASEIGTVIDNTTAISGDLRDITQTVSARREDIGEALDGLGALLAEARQAVANTAPAIEQFSQALRAVSPERVESILSNADQITADLVGQMPLLNSFVTSATGAATSIATLGEALVKRSDTIDTALVDAGQLIGKLNEAADGAPAIVASVGRTVDQVGEVVSAIDPVIIGELVSSTNRFVGTLAAQDARITSLLTGADSAVRRVDAIASSLAQRMPQIGEIIDGAEGTVREVQTFAATLPELAGTLQPGLENASNVLSAIDPAAIEGIVTGASDLVATLAEQRTAIASLVTDASGAARSIDTLASSLAESAPKINSIIDQAEGAMGPVRTFADGLPELLTTLQPGLENASNVLAAIDPAAIEGIVSGASDLVATLRPGLENVSNVLAAIDPTAVEGIVTGASDLMATLSETAPRINAIIDQAEGAMGPVRTFADGLPQILTTLQPGIENVGTVMEALSADEIAKIQRDIATLSDALAAQSGAIGSLIESTSGAAERIEAIASAVSQRMPQIGAIIDGAEGSVASVKQFADALPGFADQLQPGIANVSDVLQAIDAEAVREAVDGIAAVARAAGAEAPRIAGIVTSVEQASAGAAEIATRLSGELGKVTTILDDTQVALVNARQFAAGLPVLLDEVRPGIENVNAVLTAVDPEAINEIVSNVRSMSEALRNAEGDFTQLITSAGNAVRQIEGVTASISQKADTISKIIDDAGAFAGNLSAAGPRIEGLITRADGALDAVRNTVSAVNAEAINGIVENVQRVSDVLGARAGEIGTAIDNVTEAAKGLSEGLGTLGGSDGTLSEILAQAKRIGANLEGASQRVDVVVQRVNGLLDGPVQGMIGNVSGAARSVDEVAAAFASRAGQIANGLGRFSQGGLDDLRALLNQGRTTLSAIETAVSSFDRDPSRVIFGGSDGPRYRPQRR